MSSSQLSDADFGSSTDAQPILDISPQELEFLPPFDRVKDCKLSLRNPKEVPIGYKVKTTAPKRYCVRPNTGVVLPGETAVVDVLLNYIKDKPTSLKCKDKFQVQAILLTAEKVASKDLKELWTDAKETDIVKHRLKATFTKSGDNTSVGEPTFTPTIPQLDQSFMLANDSLSLNITSDPTNPKNFQIQTNDQSSRDKFESSDEDSMREAEKHAVIDQLNSLKDEYKIVSNQLSTVTAERDFFKKEIDQLRSIIQQLETEKEMVVRQRKTVDSTFASPFASTSTSISTPLSTSTTFEKQKSNSHSLKQSTEISGLLSSNFRIQLILVALLFFFLGKYL